MRPQLVLAAAALVSLVVACRPQPTNESGPAPLPVAAQIAAVQPIAVPATVEPAPAHAEPGTPSNDRTARVTTTARRKKTVVAGARPVDIELPNEITPTEAPPIVAAEEPKAKPKKARVSLDTSDPYVASN